MSEMPWGQRMQKKNVMFIREEKPKKNVSLGKRSLMWMRIKTEAKAGLRKLFIRKKR